MNNNVSEELDKLIEKLEKSYNNCKNVLGKLNDEYEKSLNKAAIGDPEIMVAINKTNKESMEILKELNRLRKRRIELNEKVKEVKKVAEENIKNNETIKQTVIDKNKVEEVRNGIRERLERKGKYVPNARRLKEEKSELEDQDTLELTPLKQVIKPIKKEEKVDKKNDEFIEGNINEEKAEVRVEKEPEKINNDEDVKIIFNGKRGVYEIKSPYNETTFLFTPDKMLLDDKFEETKELKKKYGINIDYSIMKGLEEFDRKYDTKLKEKYLNDKFEGKIVYDFRSFYKVSKQQLNRKEKKTIKEIAKAYSESHENCDIIRFSNKKAAILLGVSLTAAAAGTVVSNNINNSNKEYNSNTKIEKNVDNKNDVTTKESTTETKLVTENKVTTEENVTTENNVTTEENIVKNIEDKNTVKKQKLDHPKKLELATKSNTKVGDNIKLENIDLYYSSMDPEPTGNTERLSCVKYRINLIAVTYGSQIVDIVKDNRISLEELKQKYEKEYGPEIKISFNVDGVDKSGKVMYEKVGWVDYSDYEMLVNGESNVKVR